MADANALFEVSGSAEGPPQLRLLGKVTGDDLRAAGCDPVKLFGGDIYSRALLIDMSGTDFLDSSGIGWLLEQHKRFRSGKGKMILHSVPPMVTKVMQLMSLHRVLPIADDEHAATLLAESRD